MEPQLRLFLDANLLCIIEVLPNSSKIQSTMNRFWIEMMQNKYFILPGIYISIYKSNSCSKSKMHVKYEVDNFFHNWMHNWIYVLFIQLFNIAIVTFWTSRALTKLYKTFKWEWGAGGGKKPPRAAPRCVHTSEYSENHLVIPTPHNTPQHLIRHHYTGCYTSNTTRASHQHWSGVRSQFLFRIL